MDLGMIGLGRMGANMAERLCRAGHRVVGFDPKVPMPPGAGFEAAESIAALAAQLAPPRTLWLMVPAGDTVDRSIAALSVFLGHGDTIVDGGNSNYRDSQRRALALAERGVDYIDCGTSGGIWGLQEGYCLMIGGDEGAVERLRPLFASLAPAAVAVH